MLKVVGASWTQTRFSTFLIAAVAGLGLFTILFGEIPRDVYDGRYAATVFWNEKSGFRIEFWGQGNDPLLIRKGVARAYYSPDMLTTGWAVLEIETQSSYPDWVQAHAAGLLEGSLSWQLIYWHWKNTVESRCEGRDDFCDDVTSFLENNTAVIRDKAADMASTDPFWHQVNLFYSQLDGLEVGWRHAVKRSRQEDNVDIPHTDFLWLNIMSDFKDIEAKMNSTKDANSGRPISFALLKLMPNKIGQFVMSHATAGGYSSMLRVQKKYKFGLHEVASPDAPLAPGQIMSFTSYPGSLHSQDDFYQIKGPSSSLVITGTYLKNYNSYLWQLFDATEEVLIGPRVLAANRLANTPEKWADFIALNSSGTGNKQWLIVQPSNKTNVSLWVVEQLPGLTHAKDLSDDLYEKRYWTSYGNPIFDDIKEYGGYPHHESEDHIAARLLLQQGQENVTDASTMLELMRSPDISLFGRGDLLNFDNSTNSFSSSNHSSVNSSSSSSSSTTHNSKIVKPQIDLGLYATNNHHHHHRQHHFKGTFKELFRKIIAAKKIRQELTENSSSSSSSSSSENSGEDLNSEEEKQVIKVSMKNKTMLNMFQRQLHLNRINKTNHGNLQKDLVGVIDFKITTGKGEKFFAAAGPLYSLSKGPIVIEPFQWSKSPIKDLPHNGQSDMWRFDPVEPNWVWGDHKKAH